MQSRDSSIDSIRSLGLFCVILAHVNPPFAIFQWRNFDVPLMVFLSGYLFGNRQVAIQGISGFMDYLWKRFVRLVIPVWVFILIYLVIQYFFPSYFRIYLWNAPSKIASSFMLMEDGIGYVWIIRVFLYIAVLGPIFKRFITTKGQLLAFYLAYELLLLLAHHTFSTAVFKTVNESIFYSLGYLVFFLFGAQFKEWSVNAKRILAIILVAILVAGAIYDGYNGKILTLQDFKYPPHAFYSYYAALCIGIIFAFKGGIAKMGNSFLNFVGSSTIWIYLWHILFLQLIHFEAWYINYLLILGVSMLITYLQQQLIEVIVRLSKASTAVAGQLRIIFCS